MKVLFAVLLALCANASAAPAPAKQQEIRFEIRLHDGSPAAGAYVVAEACDALTPARPEGPVLEGARLYIRSETYPVFSHATRTSAPCAIETKADSSGRVVIRYSGKTDDVMLVATISHPSGVATTISRPLRGKVSIAVKMERGTTSKVTVTCGTGACVGTTTLHLRVHKRGSWSVDAYATLDGATDVAFLGAPAGTAELYVQPGSTYKGWRADVPWNAQGPLSVRFFTDALTYTVTADVHRKPGLATPIRGGARCTDAASPHVVYRPALPLQVSTPSGATLTFTELRGTCTLGVHQGDQRFVLPRASTVVTSAGNVDLQVQ